MADQHPPSKPDRADLFATASEQHGFFTTSQAARAGFSRRMLTHYARSGEFIRERRSVGSVRFQTTEHNEATYPVLDAP